MSCASRSLCLVVGAYGRTASSANPAARRGGPVATRRFKIHPPPKRRPVPLHPVREAT